MTIFRRGVGGVLVFSRAMGGLWSNSKVHESRMLWQSRSAPVRAVGRSGRLVAAIGLAGSALSKRRRAATKPGACESAPPLLAVPARYRQTEAASRAVNCLHEHGNMQGPHPVDLPLNLGVSKGQVHSSPSPPPHKGQVAAYKGQVDSIVPTRDRSIYPNSGIAGAGRARVAAAGWGA